MTKKQTQTLPTVIASMARGNEPSITITTINQDRDGDIVEPEGGEFGPYLRNPTVFFGHDTRSLPVGGTTKLEVVPGVGIKATWRWLENDVFADRVKNAFEQGLLRAASIGFVPKETAPNGRGGLRFTRWELAEWSLVGTPSNRESVRALKALGLGSDGNDLTGIELIDEETYDFDEVARLLPAALVGGLGDLRARHHHVAGDRFDVDLSDLAAALRGAVAESVAEVIGTSVREALNRHTGRLD